MVRKSPTEIVARGWVRHSRRYTGKQQRDALAAAGVKIIYGTDEGETLADLYKGLLGREHLYVFGTHRLGSTRPEYSATLEYCRRKKVTIHDVERGSVAEADAMVTAMAMVADDMREIMGEMRMSGPDLARKRRDYTNVGRKLRDGALSKIDAKTVWFDLNGVLTDAEAATICGIDRTTLWRWFGKSERLAGWPKRPIRTL